jgi:hypothetical protein
MGFRASRVFLGRWPGRVFFEKMTIFWKIGQKPQKRPRYNLDQIPDTQKTRKSKKCEKTAKKQQNFIFVVFFRYIGEEIFR